MSSLIEERQCGSLIVTYSEVRAKEIYDDLKMFLHDRVYLYPAKDFIFYTADVKSNDITAKRFEVINALIKAEADADNQPVIVLTAEALLNRLVPKHIFAGALMQLTVGDVLPVETLVKRLMQLGYERADAVEGPGQFAHRGGIVDIFTMLYDTALRVEFFDDEIDSIRVLDSYAQRSVEKIDSVTLFPMRELIYDDERMKSGFAKLEEIFDKVCIGASKFEYDETAENLDELREKTLEGHTSLDQYLHLFYEDNVSLMQYLDEDALLFFDEPKRIAEHVNHVYDEFLESIKNHIEKGAMLPTQTDMVFSYAQIVQLTMAFNTVLMVSLTQSVNLFHIRQITEFSVKSLNILPPRIDQMSEELALLKKNGHRTVILVGTKFHGQKLTEDLNDMGLEAVYVDTLEGHTLHKGTVIVSRGSLNSGFEYAGIKLTVFSDKSQAVREGRRKKRYKGNRNAISSFADLKVGDYVVHENHGIGIYQGIEQIAIENVSKDFLKIAFADNGYIYVQTEQLDLVQKFIGNEGARVKLNKLGGADWQRAKTRAKNAVAILATDLVDLYAKRQAATGFVYSQDTVWQKEFEDLFQYDETNDQLTAIEDVKSDMESPKVMDRLICGDVGYGKTEVAIRAAFKAVQDGRQVAYLVPTTILAQQHYTTFVKRMKDYPITIELLSRFRSAKQMKASIERLDKGLSDIVIGTHRIFSKDVVFKNLGLIIIDEEQRFGVSHKEKLKVLRENVDVLTLTATPIPRTLHMSLTGIRDMSVLEEPPHDRLPVQTYVMEYNPQFVRDAINRELSRGGQVYYLHNRVRNITEEAARVANLVPEARIAYAHGQMSERELERIMMDFIEGEIQVLVCTTIIETGLDIPNVNTIIIQDADHMGLSQLYQLRGRVGRTNRLAYAYLMYKKDKVLQEVAEKRLQTIKEFTEFGSGFKIAMRDMEIRGAGNILGAEQHGHMDAVGYELYCKLLSQAVAEMSGQARPDEFETTIDVRVNAYIPIEFIPNEEQKLEVYKKIASISNERDYNELWEEIEDMYGNLPVVVKNLLDVSLMKARAHSLGISAITQKQNNILMTFRNLDAAKSGGIQELLAKRRDILLTMGDNPYITILYKGQAQLTDGLVTEKIQDVISEMIQLRS